MRIKPLRRTPRLVAGVDALCRDTHILAVASLFSYPSLEPLEDASAAADVTFPYVPGFLSFREGPASLGALKALSSRPDVILVDGQGIAHPANIGIASHIGVLLGIPSIGCAKTRLVGDFDEPAAEAGAFSYLFFRDEAVGAVLRTRDNVRPLFVSPGHLTDIPTAIEIVIRCLRGFRIPEPLRRADHLSRRLLAAHLDQRETDREAAR